MSHIEQEELSSEYASALVGRVKVKGRSRSRRRAVCAMWQGMRLLLLAWSLLCLYCALRICLSGQSVDLTDVALHVGMGIGVWWLSCRSVTLPDHRERRR